MPFSPGYQLVLWTVTVWVLPWWLFLRLRFKGFICEDIWAVRKTHTLGSHTCTEVTCVMVAVWQMHYLDMKLNEFDIHKYSLCPCGCRMNSCLVPRSHHISTVALNGHVKYWSREELLHFYITWREPEKQLCLWPLDATKSYTPVH